MNLLRNARAAIHPRMAKNDMESLLKVSSTSEGNKIERNNSPFDVENPVESTIAITLVSRIGRGER